MTTEAMRSRLQFYQNALKTFSSSKSPFQIIHTIPSPSPSPASRPLASLFILDSSFNPPTLAHARIALSALSSTSQSSRILLLLSTKNADKAPQPAPFPHRLLMIELFSHAISAQAPTVPIDIGLTTLPYFVDKSAAIATYAERPEYKDAEQVHLIGYDTLTRILDPKYYPPDHRLDSLVEFLGKHKLRVSYRVGDGWGGRKEQDEFLSRIGEGSLDAVGGEREWVTGKRIELVEGRNEGEEVVSSTKVRDAVRRGDEKALKRLVPENIAKWVREEGLYVDK